MSPHLTGSAPGARLLGDVGGTHARFGWQAHAQAAIEQVRVYPSQAFDNLQDALYQYLADIGQSTPAQAAIGIANPVQGDLVQMVNHDWSFSVQALQRAMGLQRLVVVNDFVALALAVPTLGPGEWAHLGGGAQARPAPPDGQADPVPPGAQGPRRPPGPDSGPLAVIGPGTGLGMAGLVCHDGRWTALPSEGGHATLGPETEREWRVVQWLQNQHGGHASIERVVSGPGLAQVYQALRALDGLAPTEPPSPAEVTERATAGHDAQAAEALAMFLALLGSAAGNLALTLGATGGVYLGGGILPRLGADRVRASALVQRFAAKGRLRGFLEPIPLRLITLQQSPALRGAAQAL